MEVKAKSIDEREISAMDEILPSLQKKGLLTDIESRSIVTARQLPQKQLALYRIMMSKNKQTAAQLAEVFRKMTFGLHRDDVSKLQKSKCKNGKKKFESPFQTNKNPMNNDAVVMCLFGFMSLDDIKICRLVSRQWNSTAEIFLRKRAKIHFRTDGLLPDTFLAVSKLSLPELPFSAFKFSETNTDLSWCAAELENFFDKWGKNIKELNLNYISIECADDPSNLLLLYDVTPWFKNSSKITSLTIEGSQCNKEELHLSLSLGKLEILPNIKTFILKGNIIETCSQKEINRMVPVNIELSNITCKRDDEIITKFRYNDLFDFSQAVTITLDNSQKNIMEVIFDMKDQVFKNTDLLSFNEITVKNWRKAKGTVRHVELIGCPFTENTDLKIKSLKISETEIDLFALPQTIERIAVEDCNISCSQPLSLPKLKYLKLQLTTTILPQLTRFRLESCENLKELDLRLEIWNSNDEETSFTQLFGVRSLPINLQALRIKGNLNKYLTDDCNLEIPGIVVLNAEYGSLFSDYSRIAVMFRGGILVLVFHYNMEVITDDIVKFLLPYMKGECKKVIIGVEEEEDDLHLKTPFEGSIFSTIVDSKSNYYEFENSCGIVGKAITRDQFINGSISVGNESIPFFLKEE